MVPITFFVVFLALKEANGFVIDKVHVAELFATKIEPRLFNWTFQGVTEQFIYRPSMEGFPDLPSWMRYMYSSEYHAGFLYGTPPERLGNKEIRLDIVALNRHTHETRILSIVLSIIPKFPAPYVVHMKIDNLNWVHLMDPGRVENLKNIFRNDLWPSSSRDLHLVFMESAVKMGGRLPLKPQQREGVIVHVGSSSPFSPRLIELQEEVRPLYKLTTCSYKRTSVQKLFENAGFRLDWCGFRTVGNEAAPEVLYHNHGNKNSAGPEMHAKRSDRWTGICKAEAPKRNYADDLALAIVIPSMILAILIGGLTVLLCCEHRKLEDIHSEIYFQNIFHICEDIRVAQAMKIRSVQMVQCSDSNNAPTTTLKSLKDPNLLIDNISVNSQSPCNSVYRNESPRTGNCYLRPRPPPYKAPSVGKESGDI